MNNDRQRSSNEATARRDRLKNHCSRRNWITGPHALRRAACEPAQHIYPTTGLLRLPQSSCCTHARVVSDRHARADRAYSCPASMSQDGPRVVEVLGPIDRRGNA